MIDFLLFICLMFNIINLCLLISILKTVDGNTDLILDIERNQRRIERVFRRKK